MPLFTSYILRIVYEKDNERPTPRVMVQAIGAEEWLAFSEIADLAAYLEAEARRRSLAAANGDAPHVSKPITAGMA